MQSPLFNRFDHFVQVRAPWRSFLFAPGLGLLFFGLLVLLFPRLFLAIFAAFFVLAGGFLLMLAWKLLRFQRQVAGALKQRIVIHGIQVPSDQVTVDVPDRDIILH